jgi:hypothetical protein
MIPPEHLNYNTIEYADCRHPCSCYIQNAKIGGRVLDGNLDILVIATYFRSSTRNPDSYRPLPA